jgi:NTE family protein
VQFDRNYGLNIAFPVKQKYKINLKASYLQKQNRYGNAQDFQSSDTLDTNRFSGIHSGISMQYDDLDERLFPVRGKKIDFGITYNIGQEVYIPGSTSSINQLQIEHSWIQLHAYYERYWSVGFGDLGFTISAKASNMEGFANLNGTLLNAPTYNPTFESASLILKNFRSPAFLAGGLKYHFPIFKNMQFRAEGHVFKPFIKWEDNLINVEQTLSIPDYHIAAMGSLIYRTPVGPISLSAHYYDDENPFFILLNIGFLMFNHKPLE